MDLCMLVNELSDPMDQVEILLSFTDELFGEF